MENEAGIKKPRSPRMENEAGIKKPRPKGGAVRGVAPFPKAGAEPIGRR